MREACVTAALLSQTFRTGFAHMAETLAPTSAPRASSLYHSQSRHDASVFFVNNFPRTLVLLHFQPEQAETVCSVALLRDVGDNYPE